MERLHAEERVVVGLVGADLGVQAAEAAGDPGGVAALVVVRQQVARAVAEVAGELGVVRLDRVGGALQMQVGGRERSRPGDRVAARRRARPDRDARASAASVPARNGWRPATQRMRSSAVEVGAPAPRRWRGARRVRSPRIAAALFRVRGEERFDLGRRDARTDRRSCPASRARPRRTARGGCRASSRSDPGRGGRGVAASDSGCAAPAGRVRTARGLRVARVLVEALQDRRRPGAAQPTAARSPGVSCERSGASRIVAVFLRMAPISAGERVAAGSARKPAAGRRAARALRGAATESAGAHSKRSVGLSLGLSLGLPGDLACAKR